jgi:hypothetical protein
MRRGLISWSPEEMPVATLEARVSRLQQAMREQELGAVLLHTSFAHPAAVHWLTNFTPYWSEALLVVLPQGTPVLLAALTQRVHPWIREVSHLGDVVTAPSLGVSALSYLGEHAAPGARVGVVGLAALPWSTAQPLMSSGWGPLLTDVSELFAQLRQPADMAELRLAARAEQMANAALKASPVTVQSTNVWASAIEAKARLGGAEELLQRIAPDLSHSPTLQRLEGDFPLGEKRAVELSLAYKGAWVRVTQMVCSGPQPASWLVAQNWFERACRSLRAPHADLSLAGEPPGRLVNWTLQSCMGAEPLQVVASDTGFALHPLPAQALALLTVHLQLADGPWYASQMLVLGTGDNDSRRLQDVAGQ